MVFRLITELPDADLYSWGWRLPFLGSVLLLLLAFVIRRGVHESPEFEAQAKQEKPEQSPVKSVVRDAWPLILLVMGACSIGISSAYFTNTFMIAYATQYLGIKSSVILECLSVVAIVQLINQPIAAWLADKVGAGRFLLLTSAASMLVPYAMFSLVASGQNSMIILGISLAKVFSSAFYAVIAGYVSGMFETRVRYTAISMAYQVCGAIAGGLTPLVGTWLAHTFTGQWWPMAVFYTLIASVSLACVLALSRQYARSQQLELA